MTKSSKSFRVDDSIWRQFKVICASKSLLVQDQVGSLVKSWTKKKLNEYDRKNTNPLT